MIMNKDERDKVLADIRQAREQLTVARELIADGGGLINAVLDAGTALEKAQHFSFDAKSRCFGHVQAATHGQTA